MMMSPLSTMPASVSMVVSVISPAGSITQNTRGPVSLAAASSSELAPTAPLSATAATAFSETS